MGRLLRASKRWPKDEISLSLDNEMNPDWPWCRCQFPGLRLEAGTCLLFENQVATLAWKTRNEFT